MKTKPKTTPVHTGHQANSHGAWKPAVTKSEILICKSCKIRYIKTRPRQATCVKCMLTPVNQSVFRLNKN
jgi:hypothetical protein